MEAILIFMVLVALAGIFDTIRGLNRTLRALTTIEDDVGILHEMKKELSDIRAQIEQN